MTRPCAIAHRAKPPCKHRATSTVPTKTSETSTNCLAERNIDVSRETSSLIVERQAHNAVGSDGEEQGTECRDWLDLTPSSRSRASSSVSARVVAMSFSDRKPHRIAWAMICQKPRRNQSRI